MTMHPLQTSSAGSKGTRAATHNWSRKLKQGPTQLKARQTPNHCRGTTANSCEYAAGALQY